MRAYKILMPAHWASYLINGDASGLGEDRFGGSEELRARTYLEANKIAEVLDAGDENNEPFFSWAYDLHGGEYSGGELLNYTVRPQMRTRSFRTDSRGVRRIINREVYQSKYLNADIVTCGDCGRSWDDAHASGWTPAPSGRCPFEGMRKVSK